MQLLHAVTRRALVHASLMLAAVLDRPLPMAALEKLPAAAADSCAEIPAAPAAAEDGDDFILDAAGYLPAAERERLVRIMRKGEAQTGVRIRVVTRSRAPGAEWAYDPKTVRCRLGIENPIARADSLLIVGDRGIAGALEAGSAFLSFDVGSNLQLSLDPTFFGRLRQEYGRRSFVEARGEAASVTIAVELILTCLRSEAGFCTGRDVPAASSVSGAFL